MSDKDRLVLPADDEVIRELLQEPNVSVNYLSASLCVLECQLPSGKSSLLRAGLGWTRIFERTYMPVLSNDIEQAKLVSAFFDWLSGRYCIEVDAPRNRACYEYLFELAQNYRTGYHCESLFDIGCGPGLILTTRLPLLVAHISGYDISAEAGLIAREKGLSVLSHAEFIQGFHNFDVILSVYVMHYGCDLSETLAAGARHLKPSGVWLLNFHKGINLDGFIERLPGVGLSLVEEPQPSQFGPVVALEHSIR